MSQTCKISRNNTAVFTDPKTGCRSVSLHKTVIAKHWPDGRLRLCHGGWVTATTQTRMTQVFNEWGLPIRVSRRRGVMHWEVLDRATGEALRSGGFDRDGVAEIRL